MSKVFKKLGLILTLFAAVLMMTGCPGPQSVDPEKCTVTFYAEVNAAGLPVTVTKGDTLNTIASSIPVPAIDGFNAENFVSWVTSNGNTFSYDTPIVSDISLYAKFKKKTVSIETHTEEETEITDGSSGTVITDTTTLSDGTEITETTETITNPDGETTVIETTTTEDTDGNITIEEKVTDPEGNTTSQVTTPVELTVDDLIELGLKALAKENISTAKAYFNAAYDKDSTNDKALLYSALSDLSSIITNYEIQKFFEKHLGVKNYPSTLDGLISGKWLRSDGYTIEKEDDIWGCEFSEVKNPQYGSYYYYKAKEVGRKQVCFL